MRSLVLRKKRYLSNQDTLCGGLVSDINLKTLQILTALLLHVKNGGWELFGRIYLFIRSDIILCIYNIEMELKMKDLEELAIDLACLISDYKNNANNDKDHVLRWINQFPEEYKKFVLEQTISLMKKSYFSKENYDEIFDKLLSDNESKESLDVIKMSSFLNIQKNGSSQSDIIYILENKFEKKYGVKLKINDFNSEKFFYFDDFSFTGDRAYLDLSDWIINYAPKKCYLHIIFIASHNYGNYCLNKNLMNLIKYSGKNIVLDIRSFIFYKNNLFDRNSSDVFWLKYDNRYNRLSFETGSFIFDNSENRDKFEYIMYEAGKYIISLCENPSSSVKPLGYSRISNHTGFGGTIFSYRNCPNTAPLAFWWGDPNANQNSPLSQWYPLFFRKTYYG